MTVNDLTPSGLDTFLQRWTGNGGAERANYQMFLTELCDVLAVPRPDAATADRTTNDYVFERAVKRRESEGLNSTLRIDLYKKGCFILEAKQSRLPGNPKALIAQPASTSAEPAALGRRSASRGWDAMMVNARRQAEDYVFRLDADHPAPPFLIICDVGHCIELYADFTGTGRAYSHFPDRQSFRIFLDDLKRPEVRERLATIWTDPASLDPTRETARVTRAIADRLAEVSKSLERDHPPEDVAHFLMRCIFTMFAEDVDLLPRGEFTAMIEDCLDSPASFAPLLQDLWARMDDADPSKRFFSAFRQQLRHFNGNLFKDAKSFPLKREEIAELIAAAKADWRQVDPAIFGSLLEHALDPNERRKLGAHYTPRAYVQTLVEVAVMEPLRDDWRAALVKIQEAVETGKRADAVTFARDFHHKLCTTRVLDPACGTGNFLYVALELIKRLEGEVLEKLAELGETEMLGLERETVDPHQFLGLELNPRAAAIAELVVWIGYLQQHYRTKSSHPAEPILRAFNNINGGHKDGFDAVLTWKGYPLPSVTTTDGVRTETYPSPSRPDWPQAEFIVGNPPFIGGKGLRAELGGAYAEALWLAHPHMNNSADFVMYWWDRAAEILARKRSPLRRFGFITTNSISQVFQRRAMERHLAAKSPVSLIFAVADHPWTKATKDSAAVRIAMTVAIAGSKDGQLLEVASEVGLDTDEPRITFVRHTGRINSDLTVGTDVTKAKALLANEGLSSPGVKLHGSGFIVSPEQAEHMGLGTRPGLERHIRPYRNGRDLTAHARGVFAIDMFGLEAEEVRRSFPEAYQHILEHVKPERDHNNRPTYRDNWWVFGEPRRDLRPALAGLSRYIATVETAKHRLFQFLSTDVLPDNMLIVIALNDAWQLGILSSRIHTTWAPVLGGWLGYGNDARYSKSRCFDPFPFPTPSEAVKSQLRSVAEELDETRKRVLAAHPDLTLTGLYNVIAKSRAGSPLSPEDEEVQHRGLTLILKQLHDEIDRLTAEAYGWPADLPDQEIIMRLVALNAERAREEAAGRVQWLRPDYQISRYARGAQARDGELDLGDQVGAAAGLPEFPKDRYEQPLAVKAVLAASSAAMDATAISRAFRGPPRARVQRVEAVIRVLALYGDVMALPDGKFAARRAA